MKKLIVIIVVMLLSGCQSDSKDTTFTNIDADEAKVMMDAGGVIVIDVRTIDEYGRGHIDGATLLPLDDIIAGSRGTLENKDETILLYCQSGNRSGQAAKILADEGYTNIYDFGGINDWPFDIVQ